MQKYAFSARKRKEMQHFNIFFIGKHASNQIKCLSLTFEITITPIGGLKLWQTKDY